MLRTSPTMLAVCLVLAAGALVSCSAATPPLQDYAKAGQLDPVPEGTASLYRMPWRSNARTASAYEALQGIGLYYKHCPDWGIDGHTLVMKQLAACGVKRLRLAPHLCMNIDANWTGPTQKEYDSMVHEMTACKAVGIRPCVIFVHLPPMGTPEEMKAWTSSYGHTKGLPTVGESGSPEYQSYQDKVYAGLESMLKAARAGGFTEPNSFDMEVGQNIWWGAPAMKPCPGLKLDSLSPGGRIYEFDKALIARARKAGYVEPVLWDGECYHFFEQMNDAEIFPPCVGRTLSFYSGYNGRTDRGWLGEEVEVPTKKAGKTEMVSETVAPTDAWPKRPPLQWLQGKAPAMVLSRPEGFMADFSRHDDLHILLKNSKLPVAISSLGVVPSDICEMNPEPQEPNTKAPARTSVNGVNGWDLKSRGLTRSYAFWLNQGVKFVLIHSLYEGKNDVMSHALIPYFADPNTFTWQSSKPLTTLHSFVEPLAAAKPLAKLDDLSFQYALALDSEIIPPSEKASSLMASDAVALLPFQIDEHKFAIAAYVVTPNISVPLAPAKLTLRIDKALAGDPATLHPSTQTVGKAATLEKGKDYTVVDFDICDDVTWLVIETR